MTFLERAAEEFAEKIKKILVSDDPPEFRRAILPLISEQHQYIDLNAIDTPQLLRLRASLLVSVSDAVDIMGPAALDPQIANAIIAHFMPMGASIASHCPYCLESRKASHHECQLLQTRLF